MNDFVPKSSPESIRENREADRLIDRMEAITEWWSTNVPNMTDAKILAGLESEFGIPQDVSADLLRRKDAGEFDRCDFLDKLAQYEMKS